MLGFLKPYLTQIGLGAAALVLAIGVWMYIGRLDARLAAANATISAESAKCAETQLAAAATVNTAAQAVIDGQRVNLDAAQGTLAQASAVSRAAGATTVATITVNAAQPGQDAPIAPVLQTALAGLRAAHGDTP
jgi:hypothetical protein